MTKRNADTNQFPTGVGKFNKQRLLAVWSKYIGGDDTVKDLLILEFLASCKERLDYLTAKVPRLRHLYDELVSGLTLKTCEFVEAARDNPADNPTASYWQLIKFVVQDMSNDTTITNGNLGRRLYAKHGTTHVKTLLTDDILVANHPTTSEIIADLHSLSETDVERAFLDLKMQGFTSREIAQELGISVWDCTRIRNTLRSRYEDR